MGGAYTCCIDAQIPDTSTQCLWGLSLMECLVYSTLNVVMQSKYAMVWFQPWTATHATLKNTWMIASGVAKPGPTWARARASASGNSRTLYFCSIAICNDDFSTLFSPHCSHVLRLIPVKTCTACTYAEVMGQNYSRFKTDGICQPTCPCWQKKIFFSKCMQCPGVICDLATPLMIATGVRLWICNRIISIWEDITC